MKKRSYLFAALFLGALMAACGSDTSDNPKSTDDTETATEETDSDTGTEIDTGTETEEPVDTGPEVVCNPDPTVAIDENFDNWEQGDSRFYMAKPDQTADTDTTSDDGLYAYPDNGAPVNIDGHDAIALHANAVDNNGYGFSIEAQWALEQQTNMSCEDFEISFDIYVPSEYKAEDINANVQIGFYETTNYAPIYSKWWSGSIIGDEWSTITGKIDTTTGDIDYVSPDLAFPPNDWIFDVVRINLILNGTNAAEGDEILFYVDNLRVANFPAEADTDTDTGEDTEVADAGDDAGDVDAGK
jgi:hypothetical protein